MLVRSRRVLLPGVSFQPATLRVEEGIITAIYPYEAIKELSLPAIDFGDLCVGPGLVDLAPSSSSNPGSAFLRGGVTSVVIDPSLEPDKFAQSTNDIHPGPHKFRFGEKAIPELKAAPGSDDVQSDAKQVIILQADETNPLASPFRGRSPSSRRVLPGNKWRTGRSRRGSDANSQQEVGEEEGVSIPPKAIEVLLEYERRSYLSAAGSSTCQPQVKTRPGRPPPIQPVRAEVDIFRPEVFLNEYAFHVALRPDDIEVVNVSRCKQHVRAILRMSSKRGCEQAQESLPNVTLGTTISHLLLDSSTVASGATQCKLDPPLRDTSDRMSLLSLALDASNDRFTVSSGHAHRVDLFPNFERSSSNGPTAPWFLPVLWTLAKARAGLSTLATLWEKSSRVPAVLARLEGKGEIKVGFDADLVVFDINDDGSGMCEDESSPLLGTKIEGKVRVVFINGQMVDISTET